MTSSKSVLQLTKLINQVKPKFNHSKLKRLCLNVSAISTIITNAAMANFSSVFVGKLNTARTELVLISKAIIGLALVWAVISFATNREANWKRIGLIFGVGAALIGIDTLIPFLTGAR